MLRTFRITFHISLWIGLRDQPTGSGTLYIGIPLPLFSLNHSAMLGIGAMSM
jgi:hypothetical protein